MSAGQGDAAFVAAMVREFDFARYAAALFVPAPQRRALLAVAAFALEIGRIADQVTQPLPGEVRLQWWIDALQGTDHGGITGHPVAAELLRAIQEHEIDGAPLSALIAAHKFDLYDDAMPSMAALEIYCDDTEGSLIQVGVAALAPAADAVVAIRESGRALGLMRIVARLGHDTAHRRCFVPDDMMATHGLTRGMVLAADDTAALREVRHAMIVAAGGHLDRARTAIKSLPKQVRPAFLPLATLHHQLSQLGQSLPFALVSPPSRLRTLSAQWWMMR